MHHAPFAVLPLLLVGALVAQSPVIYSNGPLATEAHGGIPSAFGSRLQTGAPFNMNVLGFGAQQASGNALADDFSVNGAMLIDAIEVFGYLTNAPTTPSPITGVFVEILTGDPADPLSVPVAGSPGIANNQLANSTHGFANVYRTTTTTLTATNRAVMSAKVNFSTPILLTQGTYWLVFQFTGVSFVPPVTVLGTPNVATTAGTAKQRIGAAGAWTPLFDTNPNFPAQQYPTAMPFNIYGSTPAQLGTITQSSTGCGSTSLNAIGNPVPGGFLQADMTLSGNGLGLMGFGFTTIVTPFCGCNFGHEWAAVSLGNTARIDIPQDATFVGLGISVQGAELGGIGGCATPQISATNTFRFQL